MRYNRPDETFYIVEYESGKCKRFREITTPIVKFTAGIAPTTRTYNNGTLKITTWEWLSYGKARDTKNIY